jgi:hypothetical protein
LRPEKLTRRSKIAARSLKSPRPSNSLASANLSRSRRLFRALFGSRSLAEFPNFRAFSFFAVALIALFSNVAASLFLAAQLDSPPKLSLFFQTSRRLPLSRDKKRENAEAAQTTSTFYVRRSNANA